MRKLSISLAALAALTPGVAMAQAAACRILANFELPRPEPVAAEEVRRTPVTRYLLSLSWSPQHCFEARGRASDAIQCDGQAGRFGFVLHGLWPETDGRDWPQYCRPARQVSRATIRRHLCMTPSPELLQHEWSRHGTCMAATPERYFRAAAILYRAVRYPDMVALARETTLSVGDFTRAFAGANPGLRENMIAVHTTRSGWLDEVRICLDRRFRRARCPEWSRGAPPQTRLRISPPV
jgi:ribonuclease T2